MSTNQVTEIRKFLSEAGLPAKSGERTDRAVARVLMELAGEVSDARAEARQVDCCAATTPHVPREHPRSHTTAYITDGVEVLRHTTGERVLVVRDVNGPTLHCYPLVPDEQVRLAAAVIGL